MIEKSLVDWRKEMLIFEQNRQALITQCARALEEAVPDEFPRAFLEELCGASHQPGMFGPDRGLELWIAHLLRHKEVSMKLGRYQLKGYLSKFGWKSMNDVENAFDALSIAWKDFLTMRTEIETNDKYPEKPPIYHVYIHVTIL